MKTLIKTLVACTLILNVGCAAKGNKPTTAAKTEAPASTSSAAKDAAAPATTPAPAVASASNLSIDETAICKNIENLLPVDSGSEFTADIGRVYFYTKISGASAPVKVMHNWYLNDQKVASIPLPIKASNWRTYSSKQISAEQVGNWKVEVTDEAGTVLTSKTFSVKAAATPAN